MICFPIDFMGYSGISYCVSPITFRYNTNTILSESPQRHFLTNLFLTSISQSLPPADWKQNRWRRLAECQPFPVKKDRNHRLGNQRRNIFYLQKIVVE